MNKMAASTMDAPYVMAVPATDFRPKLIIFDCDGVLVQSEEITLTLLASMLKRRVSENIKNDSFFDPSSLIERFRGRKTAECLKEFEVCFNTRLEDDFELYFRHASHDLLQKQLKPTKGVKTLLSELSIPYCVASSATRKKIEHCLTVTGLLPYFTGSIFSCYELGAWKPDPLIFLEACRHYNVKTSEALVIEDSVAGIQAAVAAHIRVLGFGPEERHLLLADAGALPFTHLHDLLEILR
ncbi:HAD family hydrolase [Pseudomonas syringae]|uniref:HAD family hydrolase n=1 Tax=Pseudomonas syringae TaxID=317 RepID=UPI000A69BD9D|nr:HAD-IA family hydrolase [Pseudomonas syringae]